MPSRWLDRRPPGQRRELVVENELQSHEELDSLIVDLERSPEVFYGEGM